MQETKLISLRVPVDLLENIDCLWRHDRYLTRSYVIVNLLRAVLETADPASLFVMKMWQLRRQPGYKLSLVFKPDEPSEATLSSENLITP